MIAHRLSTVKDCDIIIVLKFGEIVESGSHDELLSRPDGHYRNLWMKQSEQTQKEMEEKERKQREEEEFKRALENRKLPILKQKLSRDYEVEELDDDKKKQDKKGIQFDDDDE